MKETDGVRVELCSTLGGRTRPTPYVTYIKTKRKEAFAHAEAMVINMANIAILGSGGFGLALAVMLHRYGHSVCVWSKFQDEIENIRLHGENHKLLPNVPVDAAIDLTTDINCVKGRDVVIFAVPSSAIAETAARISTIIDSNTVLVNVAKGIDGDSLKRLSEVISAAAPNNDVVALSGPSHAEEIARGVPTTIVAACQNRASAEYIQDVMMNTNLRVYVSDDTIGVELGGALKNIIAVCAGICDGLLLGDNTKAALITRGLAEIARLGKAMGAKEATFTGLTGMGDLIVTCASMHSRNRRCGIFIGQGLSAKEAIARVGMTVEGCAATESAHRLSERYHVDMPITNELYQVLYHGKDMKQALSDLMGRPRRSETEEIW